jgi:putative restriction endonuclease
MKYWWVNQNQTYDDEVPGGFLWSPKKKKDGTTNRFYDNMTLTSPGDLVLSFCDSRILAIGTIVGSAQDSIQPDFGDIGDQWAQDGWLVPVEFEELQTPPKPKDFIAELVSLLPEKYSPLQTNGNGNQGVYLAEISQALAEAILNRAGVPINRFGGNREVLTSNDEVTAADALVGRTDIGPTAKAQLTRARIGQGVFKANVRLNESKCRITGLSNPRFLIASHIKPWAKSSDLEKLDGCNGLLLSPHIDWLFNYGHISFQNDGTLLVSPMLDKSVLTKWGISERVSVGAFNSRQAIYLEYHRSNIFQSGQKKL